EDRVLCFQCTLRPLDRLEDRVGLRTVPLRPLDKLEERVLQSLISANLSANKKYRLLFYI
ncbi:MAG: hypothetical protein RR960_07430, partial [Alistipes sp.]